MNQAVLMCTHDLCFEQNKKLITHFHIEINILQPLKIAVYYIGFCRYGRVIMYLKLGTSMIPGINHSFN